jgi:hypothetical protein
MNRRVRLGILTPSLNATLEPVTAAMVAGCPIDLPKRQIKRF